VATENPEVRAAMIDAYTRWVELADLDGFRIDTVKHVEHEFWTTFAPAVRQRLAAQNKKNFLMFGEAFDGNDKLLGSFTRPGELDSVFYFSQHYVVFRDIFMYAHDEKLQKGTSQIAALWAKRLGDPADPKAEVVYSDKPQEGGIGLPPNKALVNFIDNHDVARFLFSALGDVPALRNALTYLFLEDGIPCLYYGTELDFAGGNDPANREVVWPTGFPTTGDTFRHIAKLARLRREYAALRYGDAKIVYSTDHTAKEEDAGMFAFERVGGSDGPNQYALVVLNTNGRKASVTNDAAGGAMKLSAKPGSVLVDVLDPAFAKYPVGADGTLRVKVDAQRAVVLVPEADVVR
jgi:alpha-amylase